LESRTLFESRDFAATLDLRNATPGIGGRRQCDHILTAPLDEHEGGACRLVCIALDPARIDAVWTERVDERVAKGVETNSNDHLDIATRARGSNRLVSPLASRESLQSLAGDGLCGSRQVGSATTRSMLRHPAPAVVAGAT